MRVVEKIATDRDMKAFGARLGARLRGGEMIELIGDVGAGKTTLTKGIAEGLAVNEDVQSPTFTINRTYTARDGLELHHYDFYRLNDAGVVGYELAESVTDTHAVTIVEWGETVHDVLPESRIIITIVYRANESRELTMSVPSVFAYIQEEERA